MPVKVSDDLPAKGILENENIFIMGEDRALHQDIRSLKIVILNLMPTKIVTETQLLRVLGNSPLQVDITLLHALSHKSKNTGEEHLETFYKTFDQIRDERFDGMIITGAAVDHLPFDEVDFWDELKEIIEWKDNHVFATLFVCWGAEAGLYHQYGVPKYKLDEKMFGVFKHQVTKPYSKLLRGFDDEFFIPHSRLSEIRREDVEKVAELEILSESDKAGVFLVGTKDGRQIFMMGHPEYDPLTLKAEYDRDVNQGIDIAVPENYYPNDDPSQAPVVRWRSHGHLLYTNWLNYYVYQETPFDLENMKELVRPQYSFRKTLKSMGSSFCGHS